MPVKAKKSSPFDEARRRVRSLGPERPYLNCLVGVPAGTAPLWAEVLALCRAAARDGARAPARRLEGRALAFLGRTEEAAAVLDRAVAEEPENLEGLAWRAEVHLLRGAPADAEKILGTAISLDPSWPWSRLLRAVCRLSAGEMAGAETDLRTALRSPAAASAAAGVYALLEGQRGEPKRGLARLRLAAAARPSAFVLGARAMLRRDAGDLAGSLEDFNRAAGLEASPWIYSQRADVLNRTGFFKEAVEDARRAGALLPDSPQPHAQAANIYFDQALYPEAMAEMTLALEKSPDDAGLLARRARFHLVLSRLPEAEADLRRASSLDPGNSQLLFERLQTAILLGRDEEVLKELGSAGLSPAFADYLRGYIACRRKEFARAEKYFRAAAAAVDGGFSERVGFYALVARVLGEAGSPASAPEPDLYLCGIGIHHPYQISVEGLRALGRCAVLYNNLGDPQVSEFLGLFGGEIRAVTRVAGEPAMGRVERLIKSLRPGAPSGFVTRIHPYIYRRIANDLVTACRAANLTFHAFGAVSLTEVSWALGEAKAEPGKSSPAAVRVFDIYFLTRRPELLEPAAAAVVYCIAAGEVRRELCRMLRARYPGPHVVYILAGSGDKEREVEAVAVRALEGRLLAVDLGAVLYVPAVSGGASWKK
jgi:tetratricopeptide (TPR) repeat protein